MISRRSDQVEIARVVAAQVARMAPPASLAPMPVFKPVMRRVVLPEVQAVHRVRVADVIGWVAYETGLSAENIVGRSKEAGFVRARRAVAWLGSRAMGRSLSQIGGALGGRDQSSISAIKSYAERLIESDPAFAALIDKMVARLGEAAQ